MKKNIIIWTIAALVFVASGVVLLKERSHNQVETGTVSAEGVDSADAEEQEVPVKKIHKKMQLGEYADFLAEQGYVSFSSSKSKVASVNDQGRILAHKKGAAVITASGANGEELKVRVNVKKRGFMLPRLTMLTGETVNLKDQFSKKTGKVKWTSSDKSIVRIGKNGSVQAKKRGKADIIGVDGKHSYLCHVTVQNKPKSIIYLTFDDGPSRYSTPKVLKILKKNKVKATFFELKPAKADYDLTRRVIREGHTLAIHGYSHHYNEIYQTEKTYHRNLDKLQRLFFHEFGQWCVLTRFPGGSSNTISRHYNKGIMTRLSKKVPKWGYLYFDWNVSSGDAGGARTSKQVYRYVVSGLQKGRSNVVLMHDFPNNDKTINALNKVIAYGKKHGYQFRSLTPASTEVHHGVNN